MDNFMRFGPPASSLPCSMAYGNRFFEPLAIVADSHGQRQELFQRFGGGLKTDGNLPRGDGNARRQTVKLLSRNGGRRFHQNPRLFEAGLAQPFQVFGQPALPPPFIVLLFTGGQTPQVLQKLFAPREAASTDLARHAGG
jgi:hypothetical protein